VQGFQSHVCIFENKLSHAGSCQRNASIHSKKKIMSQEIALDFMACVSFLMAPEKE
jgi:hypothetical protein